MSQFKKQIIINAESEMEASMKLQALTIIADKITPENLAVLSEKAMKPGINQKIKTFKNFI